MLSHKISYFSFMIISWLTVNQVVQALTIVVGGLIYRNLRKQLMQARVDSKWGTNNLSFSKISSNDLLRNE